MAVYNINGQEIGGGQFFDNITLDFGYFRGAQYYLIRVARDKYDGGKQYPFVSAPNGSGGALYSCLGYSAVKPFPIIINAGLFNNGAGQGKDPVGNVVEDGVSVANNTSSVFPPLTIDGDGELGYAVPGTTNSELISNGIVSAVCGFGPIIIDYAKTNQADYSVPDRWNEDSQRQVIGQFGNGDYGILTIEGRTFDNSTGLGLGDVQDLCQQYNFKFAYNLDGGGSTETVVGEKQLNIIYEGTTGRICPTFIVFNGTDEFGDPQV